MTKFVPHTSTSGTKAGKRPSKRPPVFPCVTYRPDESGSMVATEIVVPKRRR